MTLHGTVRNGQISLFEPVTWPEGTPVLVYPASNDSESARADEQLSDDQADDSESIARWIAEFDAIPALEMSAAEERQWQSARDEQRERDRSNIRRDLMDLEGDQG